MSSASSLILGSFSNNNGNSGKNVSIKRIGFFLNVVAIFPSPFKYQMKVNFLELNS